MPRLTTAERERRRKISEAMQGRTKSPEHRAAIGRGVHAARDRRDREHLRLIGWLKD